MCPCVCVCVCVCVAGLWRELLVLPFHVQQHVCVSQLRASLSLIRPYLPVRQHNKRIFKEDISLFHSAELLYWYCFNAECSSVCVCVCVYAMPFLFFQINFICAHIWVSSSLWDVSVYVCAEARACACQCGCERCCHSKALPTSNSD